MENGYASLNADAHAVAELTEMLVRHDVLERQAAIIPGYRVPSELVKEINQRLAGLTEEARAAVVDLRAYGSNGKRWQFWLKRHVQRNPADAPALFLLQEHFGGGGSSLSAFVWQHYGLLDRPWKMNHKW